MKKGNEIELKYVQERIKRFTFLILNLNQRRKETKSKIHREFGIGQL